MRPSVLAGLAALIPVALLAQANTGGPPPAAPVRVVNDTFFGTVVPDPYRWLENVQDSAVLQWLHAQDNYTRRLLAAIPGHADLAARIHALSNANPSISAPNFGGKRLFYFKRLPGEEVNKLYVRDSLGAPERLLVDPERLQQTGGPHWALDYYSASWDGRYVAYGASPAGSENSIMRVLDVTTGKVLPDSIDRAQFGGPSWRGGGPAAFFHPPPQIPPRGAPTDSIVLFDVHGDDIYLLSHLHAARYQVLRTNLKSPDVAHAAVVFPESQGVVVVFGTSRDGLYIRTLDGGLGRLFRLAWGAAPPAAQPVTLPYDGAINSFSTIPSRAGALFSLESWTHSPLWFASDQKTGHLMDTGLLPVSPVDFSTITSDEVRVRAPDGTMVPLSIVHRRDARQDGSHPLYLDGYGAYGFTYDPYFIPSWLAWFDQGGVYAVCHVRGGVEFGEAWHQAGRGPTKSNTWRDLIACGDYLVAQKWTAPARLAGSGTSAGGIEIGMAVTERPELFGAALPRVGTLNPLREMLVGVSGPANRPEFGDPTTAQGARDLLAMDTYQHVKAGTAYPAMLFTSGFNDPRVDTWIPAKTAARFQAATTSGKPVLLRVEFDAGHGFGSSMSQREAELADEWSFLLWQFGVPKFQPVP